MFVDQVQELNGGEVVHEQPSEGNGPCLVLGESAWKGGREGKPG
jgi:hypothetical protein